MLKAARPVKPASKQYLFREDERKHSPHFPGFSQYKSLETMYHFPST